MGSDDSSTDKCVCGHAGREHEPNHDELCFAKGCDCMGFQLPVEQIHKWKRCMGCGHQEHSRRCMTMVEETGDNCRCLQLTSAQEIKERCMGAGGCPEHPTERQRDSCPHCGSEEHKWAQCALYEQAVKADDPPLAPEEEACATCGTTAVCEGCGACTPAEELCDDCTARVAAEAAKAALEDDWRPPQPLRRPPYAVAYSVAGHLYEIALPGDATVQATDGGLIITHTLGPVAGVVRVHPIEGEQSA